MVPTLADVVAIDVLDSVLRGEAPSLVSEGESVSLRRLAFRAVRATDRSLTRIGEVGRSPPGRPTGRA